MRRALLALARRDAGVSLVELIAAMAIGSVVLTALMVIFGNGMEGVTRADNRVQATQQGRAAIDRMMSLLDSQACLVVAGSGDASTSIPPIVSGSADSVTFYADLSGAGSAPSRYTLEFVPTATGPTRVGDLVEREIPATGVEPGVTYTATPRVRRLATNVVGGREEGSSTPVPVFRYYTFPTAADGPLTPVTGTDLSRVIAIKVAFQPRGERQRYDARSTSDTISGMAMLKSADPGDPAVDDDEQVCPR